MENILFYIAAFVAIVAGLTVVIAKNPVSSALALIVNFFCIAAIYLLLEAQFLAIVEIMVYAGAIMVLFLFVIMLLNLQDDKTLTDHFDLKKGFAVLFAALFLVEILYVIQTSEIKLTEPEKIHSLSFADMGTVEFIGKQLFSNYVLPFEMISVVLLSAVVGAIVLAKKKAEL